MPPLRGGLKVAVRYLRGSLCVLALGLMGCGEAGGNDLCEGVVCSDGNICTSDTCDPALGCVFSNNTLPCNDANACTQGDRCAAGLCSGTPLDCDDHSSCTADVCNPLIGCTYSNLCHIYATCVATACECMAGYLGDGYECAPASPICGNGACTDSEDYANCPADCDYDLVVIVESGLVQVLGPSLNTYVSDLEAEGFRGRTEPWTPGTVEALKSVIFEYVDKYGVEGVLLIGNMPTAWYEQIAFEDPEEFPMDLFLEDRDAVWSDSDGDGIYDSHSDLELDIYVSRLQTLPHAEECVTSDSFPTCPAVYDPAGEFYASEACIEHCPSGFISQSWPSHPDVECCGTFFLKRYFERLHAYRTHGPLVNQSALIFADDAWGSFVEARSPWGLDAMYSTINVVTNAEESTKEKYIEMLIGGGSEFVYHWIHSSPNNLYIYEDNVAHQIHRTQIGWSPHLPEAMTYNLEVGFMNMFSCEAARSTVLNIATAMVFQTDFALTVVGSSKRGGIYDPSIFHTNLVYGEPWGEAFRLWYNNFGYLSDEWSLGMVLVGDPLLIPSGDVRGLLELSQSEPLTPEALEALRQMMIDMPRLEELDTFHQYQESNPQFFE